MTKRKIIFLEFNELCPPLLERWMAEGQLPHFKAFYQKSEVYLTESDEKRPSHLEPWIQWYSIHTGLSFEQHGVCHLTDGPKADHADVWSILLGNGKTVGNCGSMNAKRFEVPGSFCLPDPWCTTEKSSPSELEIFHNFVARAVQEYTNSSLKASMSDYFRFLWFLVLHGLRLKTVTAISKQLMLEKLVDKQESWRRAVLLDKLQFDVFRHYFQALRPDFSTFFLNSTAHYQHTYWRHMAPELFSTQLSEKERQRYSGAVLFGYQEMDRLLGEFSKFESDNVMLILATALSQQPFLKHDKDGGQHFYRPRNIDSMLRSLGIHPLKILPVMTHQFLLSFRDATEEGHAKAQLQNILYQGEKVFDFAQSDPCTLYIGCQVYSSVPSDAVITLNDGASIPFYDLFYGISGVKSGCHHPDGVLWIKSGKHSVHSEKLSILRILPLILGYYGIGNYVNGIAVQGPEREMVES